jgi:hypothetical protein
MRAVLAAMAATVTQVMLTERAFRPPATLRGHRAPAHAR